jgi:hypothetical protein
MRLPNTSIRFGLLASWLAGGAVALAATSHDSFAQLAAPAAAPPLAATGTTGGSLPEAVYWKQDIFLIPYQWGSPAEPAAAQAVWLFVSKDRGANWRRISEAKPQVKAFNYRSEGEGEYWFAIRTIDHQGREWPAGPYQPELRVIVDTTLPRIEDLRAQVAPNGTIEVAWRCSDANLDASSLLIEAQVDAAGTWQPVSVATSTTAGPASLTTSALGLTHSGVAQWQVANGVRPLAIRASVADRAKNIATFRTDLNVVATGSLSAAPAISMAGNGAVSGTIAGNPIFNSPATLPSQGAGWSSTAIQSPALAAPINQPWPATTVGQSPFRLSSVVTNPANDGVTTYGSPPIIPAPVLPPSSPSPEQAPTPTAPPADRGAANPFGVNDQVPAQLAHAQRPTEGGVEEAPANGPRFASRDPFHQSTMKRLPATTAVAPPPFISPLTVTPGSQATTIVHPSIGPIGEHQPTDAQIKRVGSRTFSLEYDLDDAGRWGVAKVELWGTRDGGKTWNSFAIDDDNRSPLIVTVDAEGVYGFRIAVDVAGNAAAAPPSPGNAPDLWVSVDLQRPVVELTAIERGDGNLADHLVFRWKVVDDNLEPRPISIFYSSRPMGPWSAVATNLEDTGEYAWRVERFVPARFFVRIEARDTAGNLAAYQTREPIEVAPVGGGGHLRSAEPIGPTAADVSGSYK